MATPWEGAPRNGDTSAAQLLAKALAEVTSPGPHAPKSDLLDALGDLEQDILLRYWPDGSPAGDGTAYFERAIEIRLARLRKKARNETLAENAWIISKVAAALVVIVAIYQYLL